MAAAWSLWIEAEHWEPTTWSPADCNTDVLVSFPDGSRWTATVFTYENIRSLAAKNQQSGECMHGRYFWAPDMVLVDKVSREHLENLVAYLIETGEFEQIFAQL